VCPELVRGPATADAVAAARRQGADVVEVGERLLRRLVSRDGPDGVAAIVELPEATLAGRSLAADDRLLVVDGCEIAGNLGSLVRCADAAGVRLVLATSLGTRVTHPAAVKASMGTLFRVPVVESSVPSAVAWLRGQGCEIVAADPGAPCSYRDHAFGTRAAVVVGSERRGLDAGWVTAADAVVSIPMLGAADSLNVGQAAALLLYEALSASRRRPARSSRDRPAPPRR